MAFINVPVTTNSSVKSSACEITNDENKKRDKYKIFTLTIRMREFLTLSFYMFYKGYSIWIVYKLKSNLIPRFLPARGTSFLT